jgi:hypothetical protein
VELDGCTDGRSGSDGGSASGESSAAVVAGARVSSSGGSACCWECSGSCDSGWVAGLEVSVQELSGGDGTEGKDSEGFEHYFRRR